MSAMRMRGEVGRLDTLHLRVGDHVAGKFRIERELASGGAGVVVEASHVSLGKRVALKLLFPGHHPRRFWREARAAAALTTPHAVQILDEGEHAGIRFIVMELLEGEDLRSVLRHKGKLPVRDAVDCLIQICHALAHAHRQGIVHRDLKPANLFLLRQTGMSPKVKLLDFSHAKVADPREALTHDGDHMGTFEYMSPEQYDDPRAVTHASDLWALGVLLFELIVGRRPFFDPAGNRWDELARIRTANAPSVRQLAPETPEEVAVLIDDALQKDPVERTRRIADVSAFATRLVPFASSEAAHLSDEIRAVLAERKVVAATAPGQPVDGGATESTTLRTQPANRPDPTASPPAEDSGDPTSVDGAATIGTPAAPHPPWRRPAVPAVLAGVALAAAAAVVGPHQHSQEAGDQLSWPPDATQPAAVEASTVPSEHANSSAATIPTAALNTATPLSRTGVPSSIGLRKPSSGAATGTPKRAGPASSSQAGLTAPQVPATAWLDTLLDARRPAKPTSSSSVPGADSAARP